MLIPINNWVLVTSIPDLVTAVISATLTELALRCTGITSSTSFSDRVSVAYGLVYWRPVAVADTRGTVGAVKLPVVTGSVSRMLGDN